MLDRGLWITWYDLPTAGRDKYLAWLHGTYIPKLLKKPGLLYAAHYVSAKIPPASRLRHTDDKSVPAGNDYILIFGGETAHAFSKGAEAYASHALSKLDADLSDADRKMRSMRIGERVCIMTEEARADGPEAKRREGKLALSPCIQLGSFNATPVEVEDELLAWYADWRIPALKVLPGCVGIRKLVSVSGWAKHAVLYEFTSLESRHEHLPTLRSLYPEMGAWTDGFVPKLLHAPQSPIVGSRIWPPVK